MQVETRYARSGAVSIAYQVVGDGPIDLVYVPGWVSHCEYAWEEPSLARAFRRLASFARLILFDKRGTGLSDRGVPLPTLEDRMDDVRAVMDAAGSERAAIFGSSEGGNMSILFAATHPERTSALVTFGCFAKRVRTLDYPWAPSAGAREDWYRRIDTGWGGPVDLEELAPSMVGDARFASWWATYLRRSASPRDALELARSNSEIDIRHVLSAVQVPTLVLHRSGDRDSSIEEGRYLASHIRGAKFVELAGADHLFWVDDTDSVIDEIEEFLTGVRRRPDPDRALATVLFTDLVDSTAHAVTLGDRRWSELLELHDRQVERLLAEFRAAAFESRGDGFLATFDGPARAVRCALAIRESVASLGMSVRIGLHAGECERVGERVQGIAVHIGARIAALAGPDQVLVSSTVKDLVAGSGLEFEPRERRQLKGVPGEWQLFAVGTGR